MAGWINVRQLEVNDFLRGENRILCDADRVRVGASLKDVAVYFVAPNPRVIIGVLPIPEQRQPGLF